MIMKSQCLDCKYFIRDGKYTCKAFPKGISDDILLGKVSHEKPLPGQEGDFVFVPVPEKVGIYSSKN